MERKTFPAQTEALALHDLHERARTSALDAIRRSGRLEAPEEQARFIENHVANYIKGALNEHERLSSQRQS